MNGTLNCEPFSTEVIID